MQQNTYFFLLGRLPELSLRELESVLPKAEPRTAETAESPITLLTPEIAQVELASDEEAQRIFNLLGGSVKVMKHEGQFANVDMAGIEQRIVAYLAQSDRPTFSIAEFGRDKEPKFELKNVKRSLRERKVASRFIEGPRQGLSASILLHHKDVIELNILQIGEETIFAKTLAIQDIDDWTRRDRGKPYADRKKGMLPPKLARIMVNLALGAGTDFRSRTETGKYLYDPFCGSSTVLLEALMRGCEVVGSDLDKRAVTGSQSNLKWFESTYKIGAENWKIFLSDVTATSPKDFKKPVELLVSEPFLGKPTPQPTELANVFKGLEKLYLGAFKHWTKILAQNSTIVIVFPHAVAGKQIFSLEKLIDKLTALGYTPVFEPILYHRPLAVIQRQIWTFRFQKVDQKPAQNSAVQN